MLEYIVGAFLYLREDTEYVRILHPYFIRIRRDVIQEEMRHETG